MAAKDSSTAAEIMAEAGGDQRKAVQIIWQRLTTSNRLKLLDQIEELHLRQDDANSESISEDIQSIRRRLTEARHG